LNPRRRRYNARARRVHLLQLRAREIILAQVRKALKPYAGRAHDATNPLVELKASVQNLSTWEAHIVDVVRAAFDNQ